MNRWYCDGSNDGELSPDDRAMAYGDGLFETIAIRKGQPRFLTFHTERLQIGTMRLGMPTPDHEHLLGLIAATLPEIGDEINGTLKLIYTRGEGERGYRYGAAQQPHIWTRFWQERELPEHESSEIRAAFAPFRLARQSHLAGMKHLNRLEQVTGRFAEDVDEIIFRDTRGSAICGSMCNMFFVLENRLCTPALSHSGVAGVARRWVIATCHRLDWPLTVADFDAATVRNASEVFVSNSRYLIRPVIALAGQSFKPGPVFKRLRDILINEGLR